jgi:nitric oxide reductase subunit C
MPNFQLNDNDARDISAFLISQSTPSAYPAAAPESAGTPDAPTLQAGASDTLQAGASAYGESFCASCHAVQNAAGLLVGGNVGPELTRIGTKAKPGWIRQWVHNPKGYDPATAMPHYRFDDKQLALVGGFLESKTDPDFLANVHLDTATASQIAHGKQLVNENGCAACHEINGIRKPESLAPDLTTAGSRPLAKIVFVPGMEHTLPAYIEGKIKQPRSFGAALKMPQFNLAGPQVDALVTALLAQTDRAFNLPPRLRVAGPAASNYEPAGAAGRLMRDLNCFSCHAINGRGGDMAPDLTFEGSAVQRDWLLAFFKNPNTLRPTLIRRMPKFNVTDQEAAILTDYILAVYQTPSVDKDSAPPSSDPADIEHGRQLFYSKYACQACHIADPKKDKGYIGPTLTHVGSRLNAAWIYQWLKAPQALRPGVIEPDRQMSDDDERTGGETPMRTATFAIAALSLVLADCSRRAAEPTGKGPSATPAAIVEVSGGKQVATIGTPLEQPIVVQVNDAHGAAVAGASVWFRAPSGAEMQPAWGVTGSDGQFTAALTIGSIAGRYKVTAATEGAGGKAVEVRIEELALGFEQNQGKQVSEKYCSRCHDQESTAERVSNFDNLSAKPHVFGDGAFLNKMTDADLLAIIQHGGPALNKSAEMPPYGRTLNKSDIGALVAYIRAMADPPYQPKETFLAQR